jgi:hypothetical protein
MRLYRIGRSSIIKQLTGISKKKGDVIKMKKVIIFFSCILLLLTSCSSTKQGDVLKDSKNNLSVKTTSKASTKDNSKKTSQTSSPLTDTKLRVTDFFPLKKDIYMKYKGTGNEYAPFETYVDYIHDNVIQQRVITGGTTSVIVYKIDSGSLVKVFSQGETYHKYDYTKSSNSKEILIKEPIAVGTSWKLDDGSTRSITSVEKPIKTPFGNYKAIEITTQRAQSTNVDYYSKNLGLIKRVFTSKEVSQVVTSELEKYNSNVPLKQSVNFYFPDFDNNQAVYQTRTLELFTNENVGPKLQKELKLQPKNQNLVKTLSDNTKILDISILPEKDIVSVDFSKELIQEMNAGSSLEGLILKCITNTMGDYFGKNKVIIKIAGNPYSSGHIMKAPGEYFEVDKNNSQKY